MEPPPSSSSRSQAGIGNQRDKWGAGCWAVVPPRGRAGAAATCAVARGWHICHRAQRRRTQEKQERGACMLWQHGTVPGRARGVPASTGEHGVSPLQHRARGARPGHPSHPPFPSRILCGIFWGERGSSRSRAGRVCLERGPGDGGQPLLSEGVCTYSCHQQGEIKVYLYSGGLGHCRRGGEGCQALAGEGIRVPDTQLGDTRDWAALVSSEEQN